MVKHIELQMRTIRKATLEDLDQISKIYEFARLFMHRTGNPDQWGSTYPPEDLITDDIRTGISHVICENERIVGVFVCFFEPEPSYSVIDGKWLNDERYMTIHRVASAKDEHGIVSFITDWAKKKSDNIRIDTHRNNIIMQKQLEKAGFIRCGVIHLKNGSERLAYHWTNNDRKE